MQAPPKADMQKALNAFIDIDEPPALPTLDRSTLERYATCPAQAAYIASGRVNNNSLAAAAGEEVHRALGETLAEYCASGGILKPREIRNEAEQHILGCRPDVQPEAIRGLRATLWAWSDYIGRLNPENILRFDGGEKLRPSKSGQLAWDMGGVLITSELDLLHATPSPELLREVDYKSGHKVHTAHDVADSFQFTFHAVLVLNNYEKIEALEVCVWNSRINRLTPKVYFSRDDLPKYEARVRSAIAEWYRHQGKAPEACETWPAVERCSACSAASLCHAAGHAGDVAADPRAFIARLAAAEATADSLRKQASAYVDSTGHDIVTESGLAFGRSKPAAARKAKATLYQLTGASDEVQESDSGVG